MHETNIVKLKAILESLSIPISALCISGYSQPYCSRALSGDPKCCNPKFFQAIELNLGKIIDRRRKQLFEVPTADVADVSKAFTG